MSKTNQVLKLEANGRKFTVVLHHDGSGNPFWVYRHTWSVRTCGYGCSERKRVEVKYADMRSCLYYLANEI